MKRVKAPKKRSKMPLGTIKLSIQFWSGAQRYLTSLRIWLHVSNTNITGTHRVVSWFIRLSNNITIQAYTSFDKYLQAYCSHHCLFLCYLYNIHISTSLSCFLYAYYAFFITLNAWLSPLQVTGSSSSPRVVFSAWNDRSCTGNWNCNALQLFRDILPCLGYTRATVDC